jgi:hypothetical protein
MSFLGYLKNLTSRKYMPKVAKQHVAAMYQQSGADASYAHKSGLCALPISYVENYLATGAGYYKVQTAPGVYSCTYSASTPPVGSVAGPFASSGECADANVDTTTSISVVRLHRPVTSKRISYVNQRHGLLPEVYETTPGLYEYPDQSAVVMSSDRTMQSPQFGAFESHGAAFAATGETEIIYTKSEHFAEKTERIPQAGYDGTPCADVPTVNEYPRRNI